MPNRRRQRHCFAPGCQTGYQWRKGEQPSLFSVPKEEELRKVWERNLHQEVRIPRGKPQLLPGAVPTLLPNAPSYLSKKASQPRPKRKRKNADASSVDGKKRPNTASPTACSSTDNTTPAAADTGAFDEACEAEVLLRDVDSYRLCGGAVPTSNVPRSYLTKGLEGQQMQNDNASKPDEVLQAEIATLPPKQQECVRQCFSAAKKRSSKGNTYSKDWVLECILMKMKSARLYEHLRKHDIISLPSKSTLKRYLRIYKSGYGFNHKVLKQLKQKTRHISSFKRRGGLLVDEIKLSEHLTVTPSGHIEGFVDIGSSMTEGQNVVCDHGMIIMFVPFTGKWTQIIGAFATNGNAKAEELAKVSMRPVREAFKKDSSNVTLKAMPGLTSVHLQPNGFEKMRVSFAFQLFGDRVINGLQFFQDELESSCSSFDATLSFFRTINCLIKITTSRFTAKALRPGSKEVEFLKEFLDFLSSWESHAKGVGGVLSDSTTDGLRVTVSSTLALLDYLTAHGSLPAAIVQSAAPFFWGALPTRKTAGLRKFVITEGYCIPRTLSSSL
ncbi:hypothetical protein HPB47_009572 [Ixodes persulcatus]|uniref:Uncharacterized protein n=1 Tax=Ixodes persulcatus TaxID=34615 RepID=A0AC60P1Q8_IXOPE|nr:hypothetical protein HPB47_009572 [Ixodes persulcatus]